MVEDSMITPTYHSNHSFYSVEPGLSYPHITIISFHRSLPPHLCGYLLLTIFNCGYVLWPCFVVVSCSISWHHHTLEDAAWPITTSGYCSNPSFYSVKPWLFWCLHSQSWFVCMSLPSTLWLSSVVILCGYDISSWLLWGPWNVMNNSTLTAVHHY